MSTAIKFCGLTRTADVRLAVELGASFVGAVFAGGPRTVTAEHARSLFENVGLARRVGVFGDQTLHDIATIATVASLDAVQLHADPAPEFAASVKRATGLETWAAMRIANALDEAKLDELISSVDAIVFDSRVDGALGGTGRAFDWAVLTSLLGQHRRAHARVILAGGLTQYNAPLAIAAVHPDVVDVSSGVESEPGVKDHGRMRAFAAAVMGAS